MWEGACGKVHALVDNANLRLKDGSLIKWGSRPWRKSSRNRNERALPGPSLAATRAVATLTDID